jgi:hypothetical protein
MASGRHSGFACYDGTGRGFHGDLGEGGRRVIVILSDDGAISFRGSGSRFRLPGRDPCFVASVALSFHCLESAAAASLALDASFVHCGRRVVRRKLTVLDGPREEEL